MADLMNEIGDDLDAYLAGLEVDHDDGGEGDDEVPVPADAETANVLLRRIRFYERSLERLAAAHGAERARLDGWLADRTAGPRRQLARNERALEGWMRGVHAANPKVKTEKMPNGEARVRAAKPRVVVADVQRIVTWSDSTGIEDVLSWKPQASAAWLHSWCVPGAPLEGEEADEDGYREHEALFVPALAWPWIIPFVEQERRPALIPGVRFEVPGRPHFGYETTKAAPAAATAGGNPG